MSLSRHCVRPIFDIDMPADASKGESCFPVDEQEEARGAGVEEDLQGEEDSGEAAAARSVNQPRMLLLRRERCTSLPIARTEAGASIAFAALSSPPTTPRHDTARHAH